MGLFKDLTLTTLAGLGCGGGAIVASILFDLSIPEPDDRLVFMIGSVLLALCFRVLMIIQQGQPGPQGQRGPRGDS